MTVTAEGGTEYANDRGQDSLRTVVASAPTDYGLVYVRDTIDRSDVDQRDGIVYDTLGGTDRVGSEPVRALPGEPSASVRVRDHAVIGNLLDGYRGGLLISMETDVCQDLHGFITECLIRVEGETVSLETGHSP